MNIDSVPLARAPIGHSRRVRSLAATAAGNVLEWFDWTIYAVFSPFIAQALFNPSDGASALLSTLGVFAVGFVFRPVGGILFGALADRLGRRKTMVTTMLLMAVGSLVIAVIPSYATIGSLASLLLLLARLLQGLAHGGESIAAYAYVAEIAPPARRGLWSSTVPVAVAVGTILATILGTLITSTMPASVASDWGWRIPFFIGAGLAIVTVFLRRGMMESEVFEDEISAAGRDANLPENSPTPEMAAQRALARIAIIKLFLFEAGQSVLFYTWLSFAAVFAIARGMNASQAFLASVLAQLVFIVALPVCGWLSDRIGRKPLLISSYSAFIVLTFPLTGMITTAPWTLFVAQSIGLIVLALGVGHKPAVLSEQIPNRYRTRVMGFANSMGVAIFGGTAPYLNQWLSGNGQGWLFNLYVLIACAIGIVVASTFRETKGIDLRDIK